MPIEYGPKEKWLTHIVQDPDFQQSVAITVPRIAYELKGIGYDGSRHLKTLNQLRFETTEQHRLSRVYVGVPYTLSFNLSILTKFQSDGFQIVEQILPYFAPDLTFSIRPVPEYGIVDQIPLTLISVANSDNYEGDFEKRRIILWDLDFSMKVFFYGPTRSQGRIEEVEVDLITSPLMDISQPPFWFSDEQGETVRAEDGGRIASEQTANVYVDGASTVRITAVADPLEQDNEPPNVTANVTIEESV